MQDLEVFVGWDAREALAWQVCVASMQAHAADYPLPVRPIGRRLLEDEGLYTRPTEVHGNQLWDVISQQPMSTDFSLARYWVPQIASGAAWALFCDCDFLWRADPREILAHADPRCAVMVVPHRHEPAETEKMTGQMQTAYFRKNWGSLVLWNLRHAGVRRLSRGDLNSWHKHDLHGLRWLAPMEIGFLPEDWNWLEGVSPTLGQDAIEPKAVHFTQGTPDMPGYEVSPHADEWRSYLRKAA